jgi:hypothetical protein
MNSMKSPTQKTPLRMIRGGHPGSRIRRRAGRSARKPVTGVDAVTTWLYEVVDRRARETFETLRMLRTGEEEESRCA